MTSLWGGRFEQNPDADFFAFNASFGFDVRLFDADLKGSVAYAKALNLCGVFSDQDLTSVLAALEQIKKNVGDERQFLDIANSFAFEDIHSFVEHQLITLVGDLGKKLHTGRSRNDQVATDLRLFLRTQLDETVDLIKELNGTLVAMASEHTDSIMPGYTHMQRAQPIVWGHYLLSFFEMFDRDKQRLIDCRKRLNVLPLGSGALAGNSFGIDRHYLAQELGFDSISNNSLDAVSDRDFVVEFLSSASLTMIHLSRLAEDLILYASEEFGFISLGDKIATGSSLMPQKKNPDALELIRGKTGRVVGHQMAMLMTLKGLPSCYNKDLQEDKEALFDASDQLKSCIKMMGIVLNNITICKDRMASQAQGGYMEATDLADYLVASGLPFRNAHHLVGEIVQFALKTSRLLKDLTLEEFRSFYQGFEGDVYHAVALQNVVAKKSSFGGTSPDQVRRAIEYIQSNPT